MLNDIASKTRQKVLERQAKLCAEQCLKELTYDPHFIDTIAKEAAMDYFTRSRIPEEIRDRLETEFFVLHLHFLIAAELTKFLKSESQTYFRKLYKTRLAQKKRSEIVDKKTTKKTAKKKVKKK